MMVILYIYAASALLITLRLGWHMLIKLDRYDWHYGKLDIWVSFALSVFLWPVMMLKPRHLIVPSKLLDGFYAAHMRELDQLRENPPACGPVIRYRQGKGRYETYGEFLFSAGEVECALRKRLDEFQNLASDDGETILNWLCRRNKALTEPTDVPPAWDGFMLLIANELIRAGAAKTHCLECGITVNRDQLIFKAYHVGRTWSSDRLMCPHGHNLLAVEMWFCYTDIEHATSAPRIHPN